MESNLLPAFHIFFYIKFFFHTSKGHRAHESVVCFLWRKWSVMFPKAPCDACVSIWTTAVDGVGIIEIDADSVGFFPVSEPTQELFTPVHTDISMYFTST